MQFPTGKKNVFQRKVKELKKKLGKTQEITKKKKNETAIEVILERIDL